MYLTDMCTFHSSLECLDLGNSVISSSKIILYIVLVPFYCYAIMHIFQEC